MLRRWLRGSPGSWTGAGSGTKTEPGSTCASAIAPTRSSARSWRSTRCSADRHRREAEGNIRRSLRRAVRRRAGPRSIGTGPAGAQCRALRRAGRGRPPRRASRWHAGADRAAPFRSHQEPGAPPVWSLCAPRHWPRREAMRHDLPASSSGEKPDLVHCNTLKAGVYGSLAARMARKRSVWHLRDILSSEQVGSAAVAKLPADRRSNPAERGGGELCGHRRSRRADRAGSRRPGPALWAPKGRVEHIEEAS